MNLCAYLLNSNPTNKSGVMHMFLYKTFVEFIMKIKERVVYQTMDL